MIFSKLQIPQLLKKKSWEKNNVKALLGVKVCSVNSSSKEIETSDGKRISYDKLLIATGSKPFIPPMQGLDSVKNKFTFMNFDSAKEIKESIFECFYWNKFT